MKQKVDAKTKKARKQKTFIAVGGAVLLILLVIQVPRTMKLLKGPEPSISRNSIHTASPSGGSGSVPISSAGGTVSGLPERDAQPEAGEGQLVSFELFASKDPFVPQIDPQASGEGTANPGSTGTAGEAAAGGEPAPGEETAPTSAQISVNGARATVEVGATFPDDNPAFVLVSATKASVKIGIAGGSLASGDATVTLRLGKTLTLVNTADGTEYRLRLISVG